jgi:L-malate glycosyltransferase
MNGQPLRIALIGPLPPPAGGMANQAQQLQHLLQADGFSVIAVRTNTPYRPSWVGHVPILRALCRLLPFIADAWRGIGKTDLVHLFANSGWTWHLVANPVIWLAKFRGKPVVLNYRGGQAEAFFARSFHWVSPSLRQVSRVIVPSNFLGEVFGRRGIAAAIVPNIVDLSRFSPRAPGTRSASAPRLLVARNLEPIYDNATAIRAFHRVHRQYPQATLAIAGSGSELTTLQGLVRELDLQDAVAFLGQIENSCIHELYAKADIALNPSLIDNMPISVLEAFASGVPVVSTAVGGVPYMLDDGVTGLLVQPSDPMGMADAILKLLTDEQLYSRIASAARSESQRYAWPEVKKRLFTVYDEVDARHARVKHV